MGADRVPAHPCEHRPALALAALRRFARERFPPWATVPIAGLLYAAPASLERPMFLEAAGGALATFLALLCLRASPTTCQTWSAIGCSTRSADSPPEGSTQRGFSTRTWSWGRRWSPSTRCRRGAWPSLSARARSISPGSRAGERAFTRSRGPSSPTWCFPVWCCTAPVLPHGGRRSCWRSTPGWPRWRMNSRTTSDRRRRSPPGPGLCPRPGSERDSRPQPGLVRRGRARRRRTLAGAGPPVLARRGANCSRHGRGVLPSAAPGRSRVAVRPLSVPGRHRLRAGACPGSDPALVERDPGREAVQETPFQLAAPGTSGRA